MLLLLVTQAAVPHLQAKLSTVLYTSALKHCCTNDTAIMHPIPSADLPDQPTFPHCHTVTCLLDIPGGASTTRVVMPLS